MEEPWLMDDGFVYEKEEIKSHLAAIGTSPKTFQSMKFENGKPVHNLKAAIADFVAHPFRITVKYAGPGREHRGTFEIRHQDDVACLKSKVSGSFHIPSTEFTLKLDGIVLKDSLTMNQCGIEGGDCVIMTGGQWDIIVAEERSTVTVQLYPFDCLSDFIPGVVNKLGPNAATKFYTCKGKQFQSQDVLRPLLGRSKVTIYVSGRTLGG
jgi:hypothetical protein